MVLVEHAVAYDDATLKLAAETANMKGEARSENICASLISRDCRIVGTSGT
jgi:hypothetical protein